MRNAAHCSNLGSSTQSRGSHSLRLRRTPASVDLTTHKRDGALIDLSGIPCLDGCEIGLARLVSRAGTPAVGFEEICRRVKRVGGDVEVAGAVGQYVLRQELR